LVDTRRELYNQNQELKARNKVMIDKVKQRNDKLTQELATKQDQLDNPANITDVL
jgi:cell shape-determining protein MreC